QLVSKAQHRES
ncbi:HTH-type transcriptional regulator malT, partial [Vibrio parahaemolyticus EKP-026]